MDITEQAIIDRIEDHLGEFRNYVAAGSLGVLAATIVYFLIAAYIADKDSEAYKSGLGIAVGFATLGTGGVIATRIVSIGADIVSGRFWLKTFRRALGPPKTKEYLIVKERVYNWMEGR